MTMRPVCTPKMVMGPVEAGEKGGMESQGPPKGGSDGWGCLWPQEIPGLLGTDE